MSERPGPVETYMYRLEQPDDPYLAFPIAFGTAGARINLSRKMCLLAFVVATGVLPQSRCLFFYNPP